AKAALNRMLQRPHLGVNSLVAIPHALSRQALNRIGFRSLANPCLAQAIAVEQQLSIVCPAAVDVISTNKRRAYHTESAAHSAYPKSTSRILGDHLAAIRYRIQRHGARGGLPEGNRNRDFLRHYVPPVRM